jgi:hypothetical protein
LLFDDNNSLLQAVKHVLILLELTHFLILILFFFLHVICDVSKPHCIKAWIY